MRVQPAREVEQDLLEPALHAGREIGVLLATRLARRQRRGQGAEVHGLDAEAALAVGRDQVAQAGEERRAPVGRHRHHLVLVGGAAEAEVGGHLLVEQAERGAGSACAARGSSAPPRRRPARWEARSPRPSSTSTLHDAHGEARWRRGGVGDVVGHEAHALGVEPRQGGAQEQRRAAGVERAQALPLVPR